MQDFEPTLVYRCPGPHSRPGGSYDYRGVNSKDGLEETLSNGWFASLPEAIEGKHLPPIDESSAPTRGELELKAVELGIEFDGRTSDKKLGERIAEALKANG